ncbi:patatin-like phospholipase family protein [Roseicyclus sp. F158]|uniref:Patatin-like phospholipase family protein n=1 Tax=Tropicimonas omnivorans TaxID=3075590 RepID=A0ABU3DJK0_9RHOB|nr:patatin-like phospholipase family protein [Roseicyclus sp. F158]MDT0683900.1 patatin-like phospholipase family protein [Roseicyclus sp. F158]
MANPVRITLALQGGGAHGAFTWGVLDRLLEEESIEIAGISGCSAGALNGAALKAGLVRGGREAARENLDWLWARVVGVQDLRLTHWFAQFTPNATLSHLLGNSPAFFLADSVSRAISPYAYGPFYSNPLQPVVDHFDFDLVCSEAGPAFFVSATNVRSGKIRVFSGAELCPGAILASACLPTMFKAVEMEDPVTGEMEAYWDGGYTGNPALFPLYDDALPSDLVIININPLWRPDVPMNGTDIQNRINEISFNTSLLRELRSIDFVRRLIADGRIPEGAMKAVRVHMIADDALMRDLSVATKTVPSALVTGRLKAAGREAAETFLSVHGHMLGVEGSVDLQQMFD